MLPKMRTVYQSSQVASSCCAGAQRMQRQQSQYSVDAVIRQVVQRQALLFLFHEHARATVSLLPVQLLALWADCVQRALAFLLPSGPLEWSAVQSGDARLRAWKARVR